MVQAHACMQQSLYTCFHDFGVLRSPEAIYTLNTKERVYMLSGVMLLIDL